MCLSTTRAGHVPTFLKSFSSVLERGPSTESFRSCSFFLNRSVFLPFRSVLSRKTVSPFRIVLGVPYLKNGSIPLVPFLVKERLPLLGQLLATLTYLLNYFFISQLPWQVRINSRKDASPPLRCYGNGGATKSIVQNQLIR